MTTAALVCREVAIDRAPILYAERCAPEHPADGGWQFLCGGLHEEGCLPQLWALGEVLEYEPSLALFVELPTGTILERSDASTGWVVLRRATNDD